MTPDDLPWRVLDGFGRAVHAASRYAAPRSPDELAAVIAAAAEAGRPVTLRGAGRSYGDAALGRDGVVVDTQALDRIAAWDPAAGVVDAEAGVTIEQLWRRTLPDGYWPAVVPGTMRPTLGGCLGANVHGKNQWHVGTIGEHVLGFELVDGRGGRRWCTPTDDPELFHAAIGGFGLLGAITRVRLRLRRVPGGRLRVRATSAPSLPALLDTFEQALPGADYAVGWIDAFARGDALGRGELHTATYADDDPEGAAWLDPARQDLPPTILGVPRTAVSKLLRFGTHRPGTRAVNLAKYLTARTRGAHTYLQGHVAFAFLLDYVPDWRLAYGPRGFVQIQLFVPYAAARATLPALLSAGHAASAEPFLAVLKRHRPDPFVLTHGLDGWSLALDCPVPRGGLAALRPLADRLAELTLDAGGRFYFAKDALLSPAQVERAWGAGALARFAATRARVDPDRRFGSTLATRIGL